MADFSSVWGMPASGYGTPQSNQSQQNYSSFGNQFNSGGYDPYGGAFKASPQQAGQFVAPNFSQPSQLNPYASTSDVTTRGTAYDVSPWMDQLRGIMSDPSKIQQTAGYQFAVDQGNQAINRSAASKGMLGSGNVLAELAKYGQGMGSQEYGNQVNRLSGLIGQAYQYGPTTQNQTQFKAPTWGSGGGGNQTQFMPQTQFA